MGSEFQTPDILVGIAASLGVVVLIVVFLVVFRNVFLKKG